MRPPDLSVVETNSTSDMTYPFAASAMGDSMDTDLLPELSGETWVDAVHLDEATSDLSPPDSDPDLIASSLTDKTVTIVRDWVWAGAPPALPDRAGLSLELRKWRLQFGNLSIDLAGRLWRHRAPPATALQLVVSPGERWMCIQRYHDSVFAGHLGISRTVCWLLDRVYWPGLRDPIWPAVRYAWCASPCVLAGLLWDTFSYGYFGHDMYKKWKSVCTGDR